MPQGRRQWTELPNTMSPHEPFLSLTCLCQAICHSHEKSHWDMESSAALSPTCFESFPSPSMVLLPSRFLTLRVSELKAHNWLPLTYAYWIVLCFWRSIWNMSLLISSWPSNETGHLKMSLICHSRFIKFMVLEAGESDICMVSGKGLSTVHLVAEGVIWRGGSILLWNH